MTRVPLPAKPCWDRRSRVDINEHSKSEDDLQNEVSDWAPEFGNVRERGRGILP